MKNRKQIEAVNNLKKCDRILKILRNSNIPNKDEQIAFYERKKVKQEQILRNLKRYKKIGDYSLAIYSFLKSNVQTVSLISNKILFNIFFIVLYHFFNRQYPYKSNNISIITCYIFI